MSLRLSGLFHTNVSDMQKGEGASFVKTETDAGREGKSDLSSKELILGQTIRGEIVGKNGQEIQIRIGKDMIINAKMEQEIQASAGQKVTFEVRSNTSGVISLRPLFQNMSQENNALKALVQAGIECDARNIQMVSSMMKEGMSIGREKLYEMYKTLIDIPDTEINHAVQLQRLQIPATPENLEQFAAYKSYEHQLLSAFSEIAEEIPGAVSQLFSEGRLQEGIQFIDELLTIFDGEDAAGAFPLQKENAVNTELQDIVLTKEQDGETAAAEENAGRQNVAGADGQNVTEADGRSITGEAADKQGIIETDADGRRTAETDMEEYDSGSKAEAAAKESDPLKGIVQHDDRQQLARLAQNAGAGEEAVSLIKNGQLEKEEMYRLVCTLAENADSPQKQKAVKELFVSKGFQALLKDKIGNQWTLKAPEQMEKKEISRLYERLDEQTRQLARTLSQAVKPDSPLFKSVQNLRENVDFLNQVNQMYTYVQLPLKMGGSMAHGDLYVYTNKKNLAKKDGNVSAFLHLDMEHLGMVDVYVAMEQGRITTNFYLEDEESLSLLEKNMDMLTSHLTEKGYQAECRVQIREQTQNAMEELLAADKNISMISEQSFDVRA